VKFLMIVRPGTAPLPPDLVARTREWLDVRLGDGRCECAHGFVDGGGFSVGSYDTIERLLSDRATYPLAGYVTLETHPLLSMDEAFRRIAMLAQMDAAAP